MTNNDVFVYQAIKTPQFWLIWIVLFCNTTAGIGVLGQASAMSQEMFPGHITAIAAAGLVGLMSLFNMGGRFSWASLSDFIGRKNTYFVYMTLGFVLYVTVPYAGASGNVVLFVACFVIIVSMYGGGFSTVPAYLRDMFGTRYVGAIHGILLTAWSAAGIAGPVLINYIREYNVTHGVPKAQAYNTTMYIMAGLLVVGFLANLCVKAVDKRHHMKPETEADLEPARAQAMAGMRKSCPAEHKEATMKTLSQAETPFVAAAVELGGGPDLAHDSGDQAETSRRPRSRPTSPPAATPQAHEARNHARNPSRPNHAAATGVGLELCRHPACSRASRRPWSTP